MKIQQQNIEVRSLFRSVALWALLASSLAGFTGSAVALFLWLLDEATKLRWHYSWLLYLLPVGGVVIHWLYRQWGKSAERGNNLVIDEIHEPGGGVPLRMAPLILVSTLITHLFGGSAGREGTAVQIGGSIAGGIASRLGLDKESTRLLLLMGIAAGFGAVFGTPLAGAVFALEVLVVGNADYGKLLPCLVAGYLGDKVCTLWGVTHVHYSVVQPASFLPDLVLLCKAIVIGAASGLVARLFSLLSHNLKRIAGKYIKPLWLMPVVGGCVVILLTCVVGNNDYLGLGVTTADGTGISIVNAFKGTTLYPSVWVWKLVFTVVTLSTGFKGGEVTPLFFIGAWLGHTIALLSGMPVDLGAALGFIAVFAGATNTPIACILMGVELFGIGNFVYYALACEAAYLLSGPSGIYTAQKRKYPV
jgi:H+/Cl- antiporter ClcA